jgi:ribokinase
VSARVCVVGALHRDLVVRAGRFPAAGETVLGDDFALFLGGKGANQAVAAARLGARVALVGALGDDEWGREVRAALGAEGLELSAVQSLPGVHTGVAVITVVPGGENTIVVAPGAGARVTPEDVVRAAGVITAADVLLVQGELASSVSRRAMELARAAGVAVVYNAAPVGTLPAGFLRHVDVLVVNRGEAEALVGARALDAADLARRLASLGPASVVVTLGAEGALHFDGLELARVASFPVTAVDTTGAGDAFAAALAVRRAEGATLADAVRFACAAGALATTRAGAIPALPRRDEVEGLLAG